MKIIFGDVECLSTRYESWDSLFQAYVAETFPPSEAPPRFAFETIALLIGGWLLSKAADLAVDELVDVVKKQRREAGKGGTAGEGDRAETAAGGETVAPTHTNGGDAAAIVAWAEENNIPITIILETPAERDLEPSLHDVVGGNRNTIVVPDEQ